MKLKTRNVMEYDYTLEQTEINDEPSLTVPNEAVSVKKLIEHYIKGGVLPEEKEAIYADENFDDVDETRDPSFELADYTRSQSEVEESLNAKRLSSDNENGKETKRKPSGTGSSEADDQSGKALA